MSYYSKINGGTFDRSLLATAAELQRGQGDGRISKADAQVLSDRIYDQFPGKTAPARTQVESNTVRKIVRDANFTPAGKEVFEKANRSHGAQIGWETRRANQVDSKAQQGVASQLAARISQAE